MNLSEIFTLSRINTRTDSINMPDATLLSLTNVSYRDLINVITQRVKDDYFYEEWTVPTVVGQTEYPFPVRDVLDEGKPQPGLKRVREIGIKYKSTDTQYIRATPTNISNFTHDKGYIATNQPQAEPLYIVFDKSVAIFPAPSEIATLKLYGISDPATLVTGASETDIKIPLDFHHILVLGNEYRIFKALGMTLEKDNSLAEYKNEIENMVRQLSPREDTPIVAEMPCILNLQ